MTLEQRLSRILDHSGGEWSLGDFYKLLEEKKVHLLEKEGFLVLFEVQSFPQKRVLHIWGFEGVDGIGQLSVFVDWAKEIARCLDCVEIRCQGRKGWEKPLSNYGAKVLYTTLVMEL